LEAKVETLKKDAAQKEMPKIFMSHLAFSTQSPCMLTVLTDDFKGLLITIGFSHCLTVSQNISFLFVCHLKHFRIDSFDMS
jgi:hypothetical protein